MRSSIYLATLVMAIHATIAQAQSADRITGTVTAFDGTMLAVKPQTGLEVIVTVPADVRVGAVVDRKLDDIKSGDFVGSAAVVGPDGKLHAKEVHIFPESMRGTGEGHRPMSEPHQTMTNATVAQVATAPKGRVLQLRYKGGEKSIVVDPETRIVSLVAGDRGLLKSGATVVVFVTRSPDGSLSARAIQAERDGVKPLM
jgi:hypothetical protein